jgi:DNA polymerase-1
LLFNPDKPDEGVVPISPARADWYHLMQTLTGDPTDNYSGCKGVGPVKAEKLLPATDHDQAWDGALAWERVSEAFNKAGLTDDDALTQARIARVLRHGDYNFETAEVRLWTPEELA